MTTNERNPGPKTPWRQACAGLAALVCFAWPPRASVAWTAPAGSSGPEASAQQTATSEAQPEPAAKDELRLKADHGDVDAAEAIARIDAQHKNFPGAIAAYRQVLAAHPDDRAAHLQMARLLGWNHQYDDSMRAFRALLDRSPGDREALEGLAGVEVWAGKPADAAVIYGQLASAHPEDVGYLFEAARLEAATHQYPSARDRLASVLAVQPGNVDARLLLASLELRQGQHASALRQFDRVLATRAHDPEALMGAAQARYYTGDLNTAYAEAVEVSEQQPGNFDALFLLASIERARGHRFRARLLLDRANRLAHHNAEVTRLREALRGESTTVLHFTAGYAREIGSPDQPGAPPSLIDEDLRSLAFGTKLDFVALPRSNSSLAVSALPSESPSGIIGGAVAPSEFLYRQTTRVLPHLTLRGGIGLERFGPGVPVTLPNSDGPQTSAIMSPIGFFGGTFAPSPLASFDVTWSHLALPYTPLAVRLGVVSSRIEGGANLNFDPRTALHVTYFQETLGSERYEQTSTGIDPATGTFAIVNASDQESGSGGTVSFNRRLVDGERLALDAGASALVFGYDGPRRDVDLGFFTPSFYERSLLNGRLSGRLSKKLGYDLSGGLGVQQVDQRQPLKRAFVVSPALTFRVSPTLSGSLGYTHYDSTQILGIVRGNGVRITIDWKL